jgi:hypothetical protein
MRTFLALVGKKGRLDPALLDRIPSLAALSLPFRHMPYDSGSWEAENGRVALFAWDNDVEMASNESPIHVGPYGATTLYGYICSSGMPAPRNAATASSALLERDLSVSGLGGMFAICNSNAAEATVTVWKSASVAVPVFWTELPDAFAIGTRALMLSLLRTGGASPEYEVESFIPFLTRGRFTNGRTPFRYVHVVPPNSKLTATPAGIHVASIDGFESEIGVVEPSPGDYDILTDLLLAGVRPFRGQRVTCNLTGGKDSRLVAAVLRHGGVELSTQTNGFPESHDVIVGRMVARALGVRHQISSGRNAASDGGSAVKVDVHARARKVLFGSDGMLSAYEHLSPTKRFSPTPLAAGGHGGEVSLRDSFGSGGPSWDDAESVLLHYYMPPSSLYRPGALMSYQVFLEDWLRNARNEGMSPAAALDLFGYRFDLGVSGIGPIVAEIGRYGLYPLMDNQVVKAGLRTQASYKNSDELLVNILRRIEPALIDLPLANKRWNFEEYGPLPGDAEGWARRTPIKAQAGTRGGFNWRHAWSRELWNTMTEQIFGDRRASALFDLLDREALRHWMTRRRGTLDSRGAALAWAAFSASVLLSNEWLDEPQSETNFLTIEVPAA